MKKIKQHATVKSIIGIVLLLILFSAIILTIGYNVFTDALLEQYSEGAYLTAKTAAQLVDADDMDEYVNSGGKGSKYNKVWKEMDKLCNSSGSTFIYVIIPDLKDYAHIKFIFSTIDHNSTFTKYDFGYLRETTNDEYKEKYKALYDKEAEREMVIRDKGYIETDSHITMIVPLKASDGNVKALLCVQRQMDVLTNMRNNFIDKILMVLIISVILVILGQALFLHRTLLRPIKLISDEATRFSTENTVSEKKLTDSIHNKDEIGALAGSIDQMEERIQSYIENLTKITAEKERISTELSLATKIQADMLPSIFPAFPERDDFDIYASMKPAKEVGGDFYDFFFTVKNKLVFLIADVSDKGVPAAMFMMKAKTVVKSLAQSGKDVDEALNLANNILCEGNEENMFVTLWLGLLDTETGELEYANAGHSYPIIKSGDDCSFLENEDFSLSLGLMENIKFRKNSTTLKKGESIFLYTDGVTDSNNTEEEHYGSERLFEKIKNIESDKSPYEICVEVNNEINSFSQGTTQFDDVTMLALFYNGNEK